MSTYSWKRHWIVIVSLGMLMASLFTGCAKEKAEKKVTTVKVDPSQWVKKWDWEASLCVENLETETTQKILRLHQPDRLIDGFPILSWLPSNEIIFYAEIGGPTEIWIINEQGKNLRRFFSAREKKDEILSVNPSPDGKRMIVKFLGQKGLWVGNIDGSSLRRLKKTFRLPNIPAFPTWSPEGKKIAFVVQKESPPHTSNLWVIDSEGNDLRQVYSKNDIRSTGFPLSWSPDGRKIVFCAGHGWDIKNLMVNIFTKGVEEIPTPSGWEIVERYPAWSPDGRKIAFFAAIMHPPPEGEGEWKSEEGIWEYDLETKKLTLLNPLKVDGSDEDFAPFCLSYSPDGKRLAFGMGHKRGTKDYWIMNADGSGLRRITDGKSSHAGYTWSPDGKKLAYIRMVFYRKKKEEK